MEHAVFLALFAPCEDIGKLWDSLLPLLGFNVWWIFGFKYGALEDLAELSINAIDMSIKRIT